MGNLMGELGDQEDYEDGFMGVDQEDGEDDEA